MNSYNQIKVTAPKALADTVIAVMTAMDFFGGLMIEDFSDIDTCPWDYIDETLLQKDKTVVSVSGYVEADENLLPVTERLQLLLPPEARLEVLFVKEEDWANNWRRYYKPLRVGEHLVIKPSWEPYEKQLGDVVVELDPGMAFGTGTHETTRMCMAALEKHITPASDVLDLGCGSGILSITSLLLGARAVTGVDIDPVATKVAAENGAANGFAPPRYNICRGNLVDEVTGVFDVVVANIIADVIISVCGDVRAFLKEEGVFICSGIIEERAGDVRRALLQQGYSIIEQQCEGEWVAFTCKNKP